VTQLHSHRRWTLSQYANRNLLVSEGFTLLEVLVSLVIVAFMAGGVTIGLRSVSKADLRSAASKTASTIRWAFDYATINGLYVRMSFDQSTNQIVLEETEDLVFLRDETPEEQEEREEQEEKEREIEKTDDQSPDQNDTPYNPFMLLSLGNNNSPEFNPQRIIDEAQGAVAPPKRPKPSFSPLLGKKPYRLGAKLRIRAVLKGNTERDERLDEDTDSVMKRKHLYFFPQGQTEPSLIVLSKGSYNYSILVHPLNGRAKVYPCDLSEETDESIASMSMIAEELHCSKD